MNCRTFTFAFAAVLAMAHTTAVNADVVTPASITFVGTATELAGLNLDDENNVINGNGLSAPLAVDESNLGTVTHADVSFSAPGNAWVTTDPGGGNSDFYASGGGTVVFDIDLGGTFALNRLASWGYGFGGPQGNSISSVQLDFSTDGGGTFGSSETIAVALNADDGVTADFTAAISSFTTTDANFIRMTVLDNHFNDVQGFGGDRVGLAEIRFLTIPEPTGATLAALATRQANKLESPSFSR